MLAVPTAEQKSLADTVRSLGQTVGLRNPQDLETFDHDRAWKALASTDLLSLRVRDDGEPIGSGVEAMVVAHGLGSLLSPVPFRSAALALELLELAGAGEGLIESVSSGAAVPGLLLDGSLARLASTEDLSSAVLLGGPTVHFALALRPAGTGHQLVRVDATEFVVSDTAVDMTTVLWVLRSGSTPQAEDLGAAFDATALDRWTALALMLVSADCAGAMRSALDGVVSYSKDRIAYGVPIGSFQALQHIVADAFTACEAAVTNNNYAAWAIDAAEPAEALLAARTAKAWVAAVSRDVTEAVMQIYGGIGQTWEHIAHVHARRTMLDVALFGDENYQLDRIFDLRKDR